jgi:hypothetical protein
MCEPLKLYQSAFIKFWVFAGLPVLVQAEDQIPAGFKVERYARVWERNPFVSVTPVAPQAKPSVFDKLFLASWLKDAGKEVVFVQNSETNEVQRITAEPNQNNLRLIEIRLDPNPQLVAAVLSDGKEHGSVKFRFNAQPATVQTGSASAPVAPLDPSITHRIYPGVPRVHVEGGAAQIPRPQEVRRKQFLASPVPEQSNPGQN